MKISVKTVTMSLLERAGSNIKTLIIIILIVSASVTLADGFNRHSFSASFVPFFFYSFLPDIGYKFSISENDAIGFSSILAVVNRVTYTRKMGNFGLTGSLGFASAEYDLDESITFGAITGEHRIHLGDHFYTRTVAGVIFSGLTDNSAIPVLQVGLGLGF